MAQYRQSGNERFVVRGGNHDLHYHQHHHHVNGASSSDHISIGIRAASSGSSQHGKPGRGRRSARSDKSRGISSAIVVVLCLVLAVTVLAYYYISGYNNNDDINDNSKELNTYHADDDLRNDGDFLTNVTRMETVKVLGFGQGSVSHGRDSRYWDRDDRRRDDDYNEDVLERSSISSHDVSQNKDHVFKMRNENLEISLDDPVKGSGRKGGGLYNEAGRNELKKYEAEYEASLGNGVQTRNEHGNSDQLLDGKNSESHHEDVDSDAEYSNAIDSHDFRMEEYDDSSNDNEEHFDVAKTLSEKSDLVHAGTKDQKITKEAGKALSKLSGEEISSGSEGSGNSDTNSRRVNVNSNQSTKTLRLDTKRRPRRRKFSGSCEMKLLNSTAHLVEPLETRKFARFSLQYIEKEEKPFVEAEWEPRFAGHQSLQEREESFSARDQKINCGFVRGPEEFPSTGFDLAEDDENYISKCHIAVISCIFGNSDRLREPAGKMVSRLSRKNVCFVMFMDEVTLQTLSSEGHSPDRTGFIGLWKIVVVKNLPYLDMRRVGKIPKLLPHRLFPSARYSIWLDSKLRLQLDPLLILEYFLWRKGHEYAISNHYDRHCVWEEVGQNKKLNKYNHSIIDQQFKFYQADGLTRFNASDPNKLLPSNVPEGSFIVRAHTPMSNLFSCLWFNEVDRFTSRDQLSFAYTYQKLRRKNPEKPFYLNMFKDCERRAIAKLFRHRSEEKRNIRQQATE